MVSCVTGTRPENTGISPSVLSYADLFSPETFVYPKGPLAIPGPPP